MYIVNIAPYEQDQKTNITSHFGEHFICFKQFLMEIFYNKNKCENNELA